MTKKMKKSTTNKLTLWYNNDTSYTIPRVKYFTVTGDGKSVSGQYTRTVTFHGITEKQIISFNIDLVDVISMSLDAKHGEVSKNYLVTDGRIDTVTEYRTGDDYYKFPSTAHGAITVSGEMSLSKLNSNINRKLSSLF